MPWRVTNRTRGCVLGDDVRPARTFADRFIGLMGRRTFPVGQGLLLEPCNGIHTFFMRLPIDVAFLDGDRRVVKLIAAMPPWRTSSIYLKARSVLELPAGVLAASRTEEGDVLSFNEAT